MEKEYSSTMEKIFHDKFDDRYESDTVDYNNDGNDDFYEIDAVDLCCKINVNVSEDVVLVAEKGPVALKDFPHPRHLCGNFPFATTTHESYCSKCFCCLCEIAAPCLWWYGPNGHCNVNRQNRQEEVQRDYVIMYSNRVLF